MTPQSFREWVLVIVRDILIPCGGLFLALTLTQGELWQLPLIAGMLGTPLVARGGGASPVPEADTRPPPQSEE